MSHQFRLNITKCLKLAINSQKIFDFHLAHSDYWRISNRKRRKKKTPIVHDNSSGMSQF